MASTPTFMPTQYGNFSPDQWANPYSNYAGQPLPFPPGYSGGPTDAMGRPIASYAAPQPVYVPPQQTPGTTLNSSPAAGSYGAAMSNYILNGMMGKPQGKQPVYNPGSQGAGFYGSSGTGGAPDAMNILQGLSTGMLQKTGSPGYGQDTPSQQMSPGAWVTPNNYDAVLAALSNPGKPDMRGATVPQVNSPPVGTQVLANFLNQPTGGIGAGNYNNSAFFNALKPGVSLATAPPGYRAWRGAM